GAGVHDGGDGRVIHVAGLAGDDLGDGDALVLGLVREHGAGDDVADGVDALDAGPKAFVGLDAAALVEGDAGALELQALGVGLAADGNENGVDVEGLGGASDCGFDPRLEGAVLLLVDAGDL